MEESGQRRCARAEWCRNRVVVNGVALGAETPRAFCDTCSAEIAFKLAELPAAWVRVRAEMTQPRRAGRAIRVPFGPRLPGAGLGDADSVLREITECLLSWDERVRAVARLSHVPRTRGLHARTGEAVRDSARLLGDYLGALLALEPHADGAEMRRFEAGQPEVLGLGGADAGLEILAAHRRGLRLLGEIRPQAETLDGVPCKKCEDMSLERAEPPSDPKREAMWSRCASCQHGMSRKDFEQWANWYSTWADRLRLTCRRCALKRHAECCYERCGCMTCAWYRSQGVPLPDAAVTAA